MSFIAAIIIVGLFLFIAWLWTLGSVICNQKMKGTDRIIWVIVLCVLNVLGLILYWILSPVPSRPLARTDQELKDYFNSRPE